MPRVESMDILQKFKTSHKNLLNQITNIRNTENILYNSEMIQKQYNWEIEEKKLLTIYRQLIY